MTDARPPLVRVEMLSQPRLLAAARAMVGNIANRIGFNDAHCSQITLAVDEALCNVINHGYKKRADGVIWLSVWLDEAVGAKPAAIRIVIEDRADAVDPESIRPRNLDEIRPGGLGVHIIREVMDEVRYERREKEGMMLTMRKRVPAGEVRHGGSAGGKAERGGEAPHVADVNVEPQRRSADPVRWK